MARPIPFVFSRYRISVSEEQLDVSGQRQFLQELQGELFAHGYVREDRPQQSTLIMEPGEFDTDGEVCLTWSIGIRPGFRIQTDYDKVEQAMSQTIIEDSNIRYARALVLPMRGTMAIEDRSGEENIRAAQAITALRSVVRSLGDGMGSLDIHHGDAADIQRWLAEWDLKEYSYTISPLNPITASDLAERRSEAMKSENVARESGKVLPPEGQSMRANGGIIEEANELAEVGYGQRGFRGTTPDGHVAHVPKPKFYDDRHKNIAEQQKPQFVRVMFDPSDGEDFLQGQVATALKRFYGDQ